MRASGPTTDEVVEGTSMAGRTCLVTGATAGLGLETARALAAAGARVVLAGRDAGRCAAASAVLRERVPGAALDTVAVDLTSLASVRAAAAEVAGRHDRLDVLVNNAGVMFTPFERTEDGFELQLGTNHLDHFALTRLLTPLLRPGSRVVNLSSAGHGIADIDLDDPNWQRREYDKFAAYGAAKTANVLFTVELDRRLRDQEIRSYAVHPGTVRTELGRHMDRADVDRMRTMAAAAAGAAPRAGERPPRMRLVGVEQGAATSVWAATAPELAGQGGVYLADCAISAAARPYAVDPKRAARLWALSVQLTGVG
jgi:NAD(P)-dependent dehydrogenase (short-subunit alcohol dehydrogenase family)